MRKKILSVLLTIFMVMAFFPIKSKAIGDLSLIVGGVEVTDSNKNDILGDGTCSFDFSTNTLTLNNANINVSSDGIYVHRYFSEYSNNLNLTIMLKGTNYLNNTAFAGIYAPDFNLTIDGSQGGTLEAVGSTRGIYVAGGNLTIQNVSYLKAEGGDEGIAAFDRADTSSSYALKIKNSVVEASGNGSDGIYNTAAPLVISGNSIVAAYTKSNSKGVYSPNGISLEDGLGISEPAGGIIDDMTIKNPDNTIAKRVVIGNGHLITITTSPSGGGTITGGGVYTNNTTATLTATPAEGYKFVNWTENGNVVSTSSNYSFTVSSGRDLVANFEKLKYNISFVNEDSTVLQSSSVAYGETPVYSGEEPTKESTAQHTYTFAGWSPAITAVTGDAIYTATYTQATRKYDITFTNDDDTVLQSSSVAYGETPAYNGEPTKPATAQYTYEFLAWSPAIVPVSADAVYKATYSSKVNEYTISFVDEDGTVLQSSSVAYGETPAYDGVPTKPATAQHTYTFAGWSPAISAVTDDATYTATYSSTTNEYTIRFVNEDGTELKNSSVPYGETPVYTGETPTKPDDDQYTYTFAGWDPEIAEVTGDATYTAVYSAEDKTEHSKSESDDEDVSEVTSDDEETPKSDASKTETNESEISDAPNTGDEASFLMWLTLISASFIYLIFDFIFRRKRKIKATRYR